MAEAKVKRNASPAERALQLRESLLSLLPTLPVLLLLFPCRSTTIRSSQLAYFILFMVLQTLAEVVPKEALLWKLKLLHSAALYANSRLHAVRAQVLILARYVLKKKQSEKLISIIRTHE